MDKKTFGQTGEDIAAQFLKSKGYKMVERNYRKRFGEIDLIASDPKTDEIAFVEVKLRRTATFGQPEESITRQKWNKMVKTCQSWLQKNHKEEVLWRIDLIAIRMTESVPDIHHLTHISL